MGVSNYIPSSRIAQSGVCTSTTRPATPFEGQMIYETDTNRVLVYDNTAWVMIADTDTPPGLQLVKSSTFTNQTTVDIVDCFTTDFDDYLVKIVITSCASTNTQLNARLFSGGTTLSTSYANFAWYVGSVGSGVFFNDNFTASAWAINQLGGNVPPAVTQLTIFGPRLAQRKSTVFQSFATYNSSGIETRLQINGAGSVSNADLWTSLRLFNGALANMSGNVSVYGFRI